MTDSPGWSAQQPPPAPYGSAPGWGPAAPPPGWRPPPPAYPKPGVIPLRPLGVTEILDGAISSIRAHPRVMLGLSAIAAAITQLVQLPVTWLLLHNAADASFEFDTGTTSESEDFTVLANTLTATGIALVVTLVAGLILTGILTVVVSRAVLGQRISGGEAWATARPRLPALFGVTALVFLIVLGIGAIALAPGILLAVADAPVGLTVTALLLGGLAALAAIIYFYVTVALAPPAVVLEKQPVLRSLSRSRTLVTTKWWRTFGVLLLVNVLAQVIATVIAIPFSVGTLIVAFVGSGGDAANPYELLPLLISSLGSIVGYTITWPFTAAATVLLYVDLRMRREGLDIELARASGVAMPGLGSPPQQPAPPSFPTSPPPTPPGPAGPGW